MSQFKPVKKSKGKKFFAFCAFVVLVAGAVVALDYDAAKDYWPQKFLPAAQQLVKNLPPTWPQRWEQVKILLTASYKDYFSPMSERVYQKTVTGTQGLMKRLPASITGGDDKVAAENGPKDKAEKAGGKDKNKDQGKDKGKTKNKNGKAKNKK